MKPELNAHIQTARLSLTKAKACLHAAAAEPMLAEDAARDAYYAVFHAAQALIMERIGRSPKSHAGAHSQFNRLIQAEPGFPAALRAFLVQAYDFKATADYDTRPPPRISVKRAETAIRSAEQFIAAIVALLPDP